MNKTDLPGYQFFKKYAAQFITDHPEKCTGLEKPSLRNAQVIHPAKVEIKNRRVQQASLFHTQMEIKGISYRGTEGYLNAYLGYSYRSNKEHIVLFAGFPDELTRVVIAPDLEIVFSNKKQTPEVYRRELQIDTRDLYGRELAQFLQKVSLYLQSKVLTFVAVATTAETNPKPSGKKIVDVSASSYRTTLNRSQQIKEAIAGAQKEIGQKMRFRFSWGDFWMACREVSVDMAESLIGPHESFFSEEQKRKVQRTLFRILRPIFWLQIKAPKKIQKWVGLIETKLNKNKEGELL